MDKLASITPDWYRDHPTRIAPPTTLSQTTTSGYVSRPYSRQQYEAMSPPPLGGGGERQRHSSGSALRAGDLGSPVGGEAAMKFRLGHHLFVAVFRYKPTYWHVRSLQRRNRRNATIALLASSGRCECRAAARRAHESVRPVRRPPACTQASRCRPPSSPLLLLLSLLSSSSPPPPTRAAHACSSLFSPLHLPPPPAVVLLNAQTRALAHSIRAQTSNNSKQNKNCTHDFYVPHASFSPATAASSSSSSSSSS